MIAMYSIYDCKAGTYSDPFTTKTDAQAIRQFAMAMNDEKYHMSRFPQEFELHYVGKFHEESGEIVPAENRPRLVVTGLTAKEIGGQK